MGNFNLQTKGFWLRGEAKAVFAMFDMYVKTEPISTDPTYWELKALLMANDEITDWAVFPVEERIN